MLLNQFVDRVKKEDVILIDLRSKEEREEQGYIRESLHINYDGFVEEFMSSRVSHSACIFLFCTLGSRAQIAAKELRELGYLNVEFLDADVVEFLNAF